MKSLLTAVVLSFTVAGLAGCNCSNAVPSTDGGTGGGSGDGGTKDGGGDGGGTGGVGGGSGGDRKSVV